MNETARFWAAKGKVDFRQAGSPSSGPFHVVSSWGNSPKKDVLFGIISNQSGQMQTTPKLK